MNVADLPLITREQIATLPEGHYRIGRPHAGEVWDAVRSLMHRGQVQNCIAIRDGRGKETPRGMRVTVRADGLQVIPYRVAV